MLRTWTFKLGFLAIFAASLFARPCLAVDPLGIEGTYKFPPVDIGGLPLSIPAQVIITGVSNTEYNVSIAQQIVIPFVGCILNPGFVYVKLTSLGGNQFMAETTFFKDALCQLETKSPKEITLVKNPSGRPSGILLDYISTNDIDQFFELVGGTVSDTSAPTVTNKSAKVKAGKKATLKYQVNENSGQTSEVVEIYLGKRLIKTIVVALGLRAAGVDYSVKWKAPAKAAGKTYKFLVRSIDAAGNIGESVKKSIKVTA